jgi:hypothetical protein
MTEYYKIKLNNTRAGEVIKHARSGDLLECVKILNNYVEDTNLGSSEMDIGFGDVLDDNDELICNISYNGLIINFERRKW